MTTIINDKQLPAIVCFRCTRRCNLKCGFCFACNRSSELTTSEILKLLLTLKEHGTISVRLGGGEPTVRQDLDIILSYAVSIGLNIFLSSNLYHISDTVFKTIVRYRIPVLTSIHGNKEYHDMITGCDGSFDNVCKNIIKPSHKSIPVTVHFVVMPDNIQYAEYVINKCINLSVKKITFQTCIPRERGTILFEQSNYNKDSIESQMDYIKELAEQYKRFIRIKTINMFEKYYYVLEPNRVIYLQKGFENEDEVYCSI